MRRELVLIAMAGGLAARWAVAAPLAERGHVVFEHWCAPCHAPGPGHPGTAGLAVKYGNAEPAALEQRTDLSPDVIRYFVRQGFSVMAPFRKTEITDADLDDLAAYLTEPKNGATREGRK